MAAVCGLPATSRLLYGVCSSKVTRCTSKSERLFFGSRENYDLAQARSCRGLKSLSNGLTTNLKGLAFHGGRVHGHNCSSSCHRRAFAVRCGASKADERNLEGQEMNIAEMIAAANSAAIDSLGMRKEEADRIPTRAVSLTLHGVTSLEAAARLEQQLLGLEGVEGVWMGSLKEGGLRSGSVPAQLEVDRQVEIRELLDRVHELEEESLLALPFEQHAWQWRGHSINYAVAGCGKPPLILVHGFGGNVGHFRHLIAHLADDHRVYALDLLGFGASDKPADVDYGPDLWAQLVNDFAGEFAQGRGEQAVLVGNSIGSLTALTAAAQAAQARSDLYKGLVLLNCTGAMNRKGLAQDDALLAAMTPIFVLVERLLSSPRIANYLFKGFRNRENVKKILQQQVYRDKTAVTDQLVDILCEPSEHPGAIDVFVKVFLGEPGLRPEALMEMIRLPMLVLWGDKDPWTPPNGKLARYFKSLETQRDNVRVVPLPDVGHCPHDDRPELAANLMKPWLAEL